MDVYVDFDDVVSETARYFTSLVYKLFGKIVSYNEMEFFDLQKSFSLTQLQYETMMEYAHRPQELLSYGETAGACRTIKKWMDSGHNVQIVTGRPYSSLESTRQWLFDHGIKEIEIVCVDKYGREPVKDINEKNRALTPQEFEKLKFDFAVEDSPAAFVHLEKLPCCRVAVFNRPWNKNVSLPSEKFFRCNDWQEIDNLFAH